MISVIIPYNKDRGFLTRCIKSIESQEYKDFEIILSQSDKSVAWNFNRGLEKAKGEYCKFVCEDDALVPGSLQTLHDAIQDEFWVFANAIQETENGQWIYRPGDYSRDFLKFSENVVTNRIHGGTTLYRTPILQAIGGMDETLWTGEEYDMHLKLWSKGFIPGYVDKVVYLHTLWSGQKSKILRQTRKSERDEEIKRIQARYTNPVQ